MQVQCKDVVVTFLTLSEIVGLLYLGYWSLQAKSLAWCLVRLVGAAVVGMLLVALVTFIVLGVIDMGAAVPVDF
jgi:ABC-type thiamin/hydroxymethylpyrimidine transport system permease subunit